MEIISRLLRGLLILTASLLTCISLSANRLSERGSLADWIDDCSAFLEAQRKGEELANEAHSTVERVELKEKIAAALRSGEMTLFEAAAYFRWLHDDPKSWHHPQRPRPGSEDSEGWCREAIAWTQQYMMFHQTTSQADGLRQKLETELQKQLKRRGNVKVRE